MLSWQIWQLMKCSLDTAVKRDSVTSHAKALGYTPTSAQAAKAYIDVTVNNANLASITMNPGHAYTTTINGINYQFVNITQRILQPTAGVYTYSNIPIYEGSWVTTRFTVDVS